MRVWATTNSSPREWAWAPRALSKYSRQRSKLRIFLFKSKTRHHFTILRILWHQHLAEVTKLITLLRQPRPRVSLHRSVRNSLRAEQTASTIVWPASTFMTLPMGTLHQQCHMIIQFRSRNMKSIPKKHNLNKEIRIWRQMDSIIRFIWGAT